jgi:hypothetical protein
LDGPANDWTRATANSEEILFEQKNESNEPLGEYSMGRANLKEQRRIREQERLSRANSNRLKDRIAGRKTVIAP